MPSFEFQASSEGIPASQRMDIDLLLHYWLPLHDSVYIAGMASHLMVVESGLYAQEMDIGGHYAADTTQWIYRWDESHGYPLGEDRIGQPNR